MEVLFVFANARMTTLQNRNLFKPKRSTGPDYEKQAQAHLHAKAQNKILPRRIRCSKQNIIALSDNN